MVEGKLRWLAWHRTLWKVFQQSQHAQAGKGFGVLYILHLFLLSQRVSSSSLFLYCLSRLQEIEDLNVMHKFDRRLERLAMVMPLTDHFDPGVTHFAHEHLQVGASSLVMSHTQSLARPTLLSGVRRHACALLSTPVYTDTPH